MELLLHVSLCLLTFIGKTFSDEIGTKKISSEEDKDVILNCSFNEKLTTKRFDWKKDEEDVFLYENGSVKFFDEEFNQRVSYFPNQLDSGNASITIKKAQISDRGTYTCLHIDSGKSCTIELTVGSFGKPSVQRLNTDAGMALLRCEVLGAYPKPTLVWYDSAGNKIPDNDSNCTKKEDHYDIFLETKVDKTGAYTCVATQEEIHHQSNKTTSIYIGGSSYTTVIAVVFGVLLLGALVIIVFLVLKKQSGREGKTDNSTDDGTEDAASSDERNHLGAQDNA